MAEWFVGPVMDNIINTCFEYMQNQFTGQTGMKKELERLREIHPKITAVVSAANRAQIIGQNTALNKWIWQLRDAIDEADDLLDDFEYLRHKEQLDRNKEDTKKRSYLHNLYNTAKRLCVGKEDPLKSESVLKRLEEVVHKLDRISAEVSTFFYLLENIKQEQREHQVELHKTRETGSLPRNVLIGRGKDKYSVIEWLRKPSNEDPQTHSTTLYNNISLLSIVGHGGMGKTTLLQHVYADEMTKEFDPKMWVCVSDNFDVKKVITDMLESINHSRPSLESLNTLQESLQSKVMSKKFLLVLDDLWDKEDEVILRGKWGDVLAPLAYGGLGSKILITTRTESVASMIAKMIRKKKEALRLEGLKEDECLQLLTTHAFDDVENPDDYKKLRSIAVELVKKLYGSPLAAKVMGGVLNSSLDERHWRTVLNSNLGHNDIFPILKLSYIFLPEHLQRCFSFCSIFKQDHIFKRKDLIRIWIAVGFIQPSHNNQGEALSLEDIGESYFDVLIKKSFFDKDLYNGKHIVGRYKMHDLLNELAQSISANECYRFVGDEKSLFIGISETIRHLSVDTSNPEVLKNVGSLKNLRTLRITCHNQGFVDALNEMLKVTRRIRLLHINYDLLEAIPENIGHLHHLRYLRFEVSNVQLLARSLTSLYHLQFLTINERIRIHYRNSDNDYSPRDMVNLSNLRYMSSRLLNFPGIGKLNLLQKLAFNIKNENGYRFDELEHMNDVRVLKITVLENVRDAEEVSNAKLCDKRKLTHLSLLWRLEERDFADHDLDERVLNNLQPHNYLKTLHIWNYMGARSAIWMNEAHLINNLEEIHLIECLEWEILPPFGQLPFLKTLVLSEMPKVKRLENKFHGNDMCSVFPSLQTLSFTNLEELVDWFDASVVDDLFPSLTKLFLYNCPNLQELPYLPPKLKSLEIHEIGWKTLNCCSISNSIPLEFLKVCDCENIASISLVGEIGKLKWLELENLPSLQSLPFSLTNISSFGILEVKMLPQHLELPDLQNLKILESLEDIFLCDCLEWEILPPFGHLPFLKTLCIREMPKVKRLENKFLGNDMCCVFPSLQSLSIMELEALVDWFDASVVDGLFPCLTALYLRNCPNLQELPYLPPKLESLSIDNIEWKTLNCCSISKSTPLKELEVLQCQNITSISLASEIGKLEKLTIKDCPNLISIQEAHQEVDAIENCQLILDNLTISDPSVLQMLSLRSTSIRSLTIEDNDELFSFPLEAEQWLLQVSSSLRELHFNDLRSLQSLPSSLASISSLEILSVNGLLQLRELPDLPPSIKNLSIRNCHPDLMNRYPGSDYEDDQEWI